MKRIHLLCLTSLFATLVLGAGCDSNDPNEDTGTAAEHAALLEADRSWAAAAAAGDVERVLTAWSDDAINFFPGAPPAVGKEAIGDLVRRNRSIPGFSLTWEATQAFVASSGDLGYTMGTFRLTVTDADGHPIAKTGNYVCIWKRQPDGSWKCAVEVSTFGPPAA